MKMQFHMNELVVSGQMKEMEVSVGDPRIIIHHLVKSVYQFPKITMVQEISSNAKDANAEAGNAHIPVRIKVPNILDPDLIISDNGIGISPDRIENIFVKIGNSTKRGENISDGSYGIGSKIPLAYTDQFSVKTVTKEGEHLIRRMYAIVKRDDFTIKCMELGEAHIINSADDIEDQHTGTSITIPILADDIAEIRKTCIEKTEFWSVRPTLSGGTDIELSYETRDWFYKDEDFLFTVSRCGHSYDNSLVVAIINGVRYPITANHNTNSNRNKSDAISIKKEVYYPRFQGSIFLNFKVGQLTPALNRESLQYDERTCETLNKRIRAALNTIKCKIASIIEDEPTYLNAYMKLKDFNSTEWIDDSAMTNGSILWHGHKLVYRITADGEPIADTNKMDYSNADVTFMGFSYNSSRNEVRDRQENEIDIGTIASLVLGRDANYHRYGKTYDIIPHAIVYTEKPHVNISALKFLFNEKKINTKGFCCRHVIFRGSKADVEKFLTKHHLEEVIPTMICLDTCGYKRAETGAGLPRSVGEKKKVHMWRMIGGRWNRKMETCGYFGHPNQSGYYYIFDRNNGSTESLDVGNGKTMNSYSMYDIIESLNMGDKIYGIAPGNVKFLDKTLWKPLCEIFSTGENKHLADAVTDYQEFIIHRNNKNSDAFHLGKYTKINVSKITASNSPMSMWIKEAKGLTKIVEPSKKLFNAQSDNSDIILEMVKCDIIKDIAKDATVYPVVKLFNDMLCAYPLMSFINDVDMSNAGKHMTEYINLCDANAGVK